MTNVKFGITAGQEDIVSEEQPTFFTNTNRSRASHRSQYIFFRPLYLNCRICYISYALHKPPISISWTLRRQPWPLAMIRQHVSGSTKLKDIIHLNVSKCRTDNCSWDVVIHWGEVAVRHCRVGTNNTLHPCSEIWQLLTSWTERSRNNNHV
jgi:hypothetical protein